MNRLLALLVGAFFMCAPAHAERIYILKGLTHYVGEWPVDGIAEDLRAQGHDVTVSNHTEGDDITELPEIGIAHSMGANALLKATQRLILEGHKPPLLILTIDPGKWPLYSYCTVGVRCVNLYAPRALIAGQVVYDPITKKPIRENYHLTGTVHASMPAHPKVRATAVRIVGEVLKGAQCAPEYMCNGTKETNADWCCPTKGASQ